MENIVKGKKKRHLDIKIDEKLRRTWSEKITLSGAASTSRVGKRLGLPFPRSLQRPQYILQYMLDLCCVLQYICQIFVIYYNIYVRSLLCTTIYMLGLCYVLQQYMLDLCCVPSSDISQGHPPQLTLQTARELSYAKPFDKCFINVFFPVKPHQFPYLPIRGKIDSMHLTQLQWERYE